MEELEKKLIVILEKAISAAEKTGDFVIEQAPLVLQEFYAWRVWHHSLEVLLGLFLILVAFILLKALGKKDEFFEFGDRASKIMGKYYSMDAKFTLGFLGGAITIAGMIMICIGVYNLVFIIVAPKIYLIEYFIQ